MPEGIQMNLKIYLDDDSYKCLLKHVSHKALSRAAISDAPLLGHTRVIDCDELEARDLLFNAQSQCPGGVCRITEAMLSAGLTP